MSDVQTFYVILKFEIFVFQGSVEKRDNYGDRYFNSRAIVPYVAHS